MCLENLHRTKDAHNFYEYYSILLNNNKLHRATFETTQCHMIDKVLITVCRRSQFVLNRYLTHLKCWNRCFWNFCILKFKSNVFQTVFHIQWIYSFWCSSKDCSEKKNWTNKKKHSNRKLKNNRTQKIPFPNKWVSNTWKYAPKRKCEL